MITGWLHLQYTATDTIKFSITFSIIKHTNTSSNSNINIDIISDTNTNADGHSDTHTEVDGVSVYQLHNDNGHVHHTDTHT